MNIFVFIMIAFSRSFYVYLCNILLFLLIFVTFLNYRKKFITGDTSEVSIV